MYKDWGTGGSTIACRGKAVAEQCKEGSACNSLADVIIGAFASLFFEAENSFIPRGQTRAQNFDEGQITHLICARLKYDLYDFFRGVFGPFLQEKEQEAGPKHP